MHKLYWLIFIQATKVIQQAELSSDFFFFRICRKHFETCFDSSELPYKQTPKSRMAIVKFIHFISQHKAHIDPCTLSSQKLVVFLVICGSNIASKASNWATDILKENNTADP